MRAGRLRHRLELLGGDVVVRDAAGQPRKIPAVLATCWAGVRPSRRDEAVEGGKVVASTLHEVTLRRQGPIDCTMKLRFVGTDRILQILSVVDVDERRASYELACLERTTP